MDRRAVIVALAAAAGCKDAAAEATVQEGPWSPEPRHGVDLPHDWEELPEIAESAVHAALETLDGVAVHAHAWGEPSRGCYFAVVELHGKRRDSIEHLKKELQDALDDRVQLDSWTTSPDAEETSEIDARFAGDEVSGQLHAHLVLDRQRIPHALAAACFYNDREPTVCENTCTPLLAMLAPLQAPPAP